jgi:hypothetical protein
MKKTESNYFNMAKSVCEIFENSKNSWKSKSLIVASYERLKILCDSISIVAAKQKENAPKGHTVAKKAARIALKDLLFSVGRKLRAFARLENDAVIENQSNFSRSALDRLSLNNLLNFARAIAEMCKVRFEQLKPYEIDDVMITNLQEATEKLEKLSAYRDAVIDFRVENTSSLADLISKIRQELKTLDALVEGFVEDEAFLNVYFNSRRIHDVKGGSKKVGVGEEKM